jgi:TolB-like protein
VDGAKLIQLDDGTLVEVYAESGEARPIAEGFVEKVSANFDKMKSVIVNASHSILGVCGEIGQESNVDHAEVEMGLSFTAEGSVYVAKAGGTANLKVKFVLKPNNK